jgi:hypothetical protein
MSKPVQWPASTEAADKAVTKDDCFDLPEPGSAYEKELVRASSGAIEALVARGVLPKDLLKTSK